MFPCESVYATIEVKSRLDSSELANAIQNVRSVKELRRAPSDMLDITSPDRLIAPAGAGAI